MRLPIDRELLTQAVIVAGACVGGWLVLVGPRIERLREADAANVATRQRAAPVRAAAVAEAADRTARLDARCEQIESRSRLSADTARLFGLIMDLAAKHRVAVNNLQPRVEGVPGAGAVSVTRIDVSVDGEYAALVGFLAGLRDLPAYVRIGSVQIMPASGGKAGLATMQLACDALSFALPEAARRLRRKGGHG